MVCISNFTEKKALPQYKSSGGQIFWALCTFRELKKALLKLGEKFEDSEIHDLIKICDSNRDNKIDFQEFVDMMTLR